MKPCPRYAHELAAAADRGKEPAAELRAHLRQCPGCQAAFEELRGIAALQCQTAAHLPNPRFRPQLDRWFLRQVTGPSRQPAAVTAFLALRTRALAVGTALLLVASFGLHLALHKTQENDPVGTLVKDGQMAEPDSAIDSLAPTWQGLRHEVASDGRACERAYRGGTGSFASQHRLKDAYFATD